MLRMKTFETLLPWKRTIHFSIAIIVLLTFFNFYGLYTNSFPVLKPENFVFPLVSIIHFIFLYVLWFKIREDETTDPQMRTIEYLLYGVIVLYVLYTVNTVVTLFSFTEFSNHVIPATFFPVGIFTLLLQLSLLLLSILAINYRIKMVGNYNFEDLNEHIDSWEQ
ncbi:hypothetical protein SAMN04488513_102174 [Pseudozobellia thermophila]|uniref:Uncharacterized protein n=2 Tax=Pseudozobellia thermophila TaxID=192903 RepID=A0A1M6ETX9_9FLAO|nr:hypothetical protein SAMN04488513_102174 [Pseudozobellia thermophila]